MSELIGRILKGVGGLYSIKYDNDIFSARAKGKFRKLDISPVPGDMVLFSLNEDKTANIEKILERKNFFVRPHLSNIDNIFIVSSAANPAPDTYFIDKVCVIAEKKAVTPIIIFNKTDIQDCDDIAEVYKKSGYRVVLTCAKENQGIDEIKALLRNSVSAFCGFSGVGKSSIMQLIDSRIIVETGDVSQKLKRGKHTTRHVEFFELDNNCLVADTPGFSAIDILKYDKVLKAELADLFPEFNNYSDDCKFNGCTHINQKGCAVIQALKENKISQSRYNSYIRLYDEIKNINEWEI